MSFVRFESLRGTLVTLVGVTLCCATAQAASTGASAAKTRTVGSVSSATIVNLGALIGPAVRFVPTAINARGQIVGYDDRRLTNGNAGAAYLIDPDGSVGTLDRTGTTAAFVIPVAVGANGDTATGETYPDARPGLIQWRLSSGAHSHQLYRYVAATSASVLETVTGIADGNVPVGGTSFYGATSFSSTPFKTNECALTDFLASAANGGQTIAGSAGGYAALDTLTGCPTFVPGVPRPAHTTTSVVAENGSGALVGILQGPAAPAFGAYYLVLHGTYAHVTLPPTFSSATFFVQTAMLGDTNVVVGNVARQAPPFVSVAPYVFASGRSIDANAFLPPHSGWSLVTADGVDGSGTIVGTGYYNGLLQGYALHP